MKNVAPPLRPLVLVIALSSCSEEGTIGRERCLGENTRCEPLAPAQNTYDISNAKPVSSDVTREAKLDWSVDLECAGRCNALTTQLIDDGAGGVWIFHLPALGGGGLGALGPLSQSTPGIRYERINDQGDIVLRKEEPFPNDGVFSVDPFSRAWLHPDGGLVLPRTSSLLEPGRSLEYVHRLTRIGESGLEDLVVGRSMQGSWVGYSGPEQNFAAMPIDDGFITVMLAPEAQVVRKIDATGATIWRQVELPSDSEMTWSMIPLDAGFAVLMSAEPLPAGLTSQTLLWFDDDGNVTAHGWLPFIGMNARPTLLGLSGARVALGGVAASLNDSDSGGYILDLHVVRLAPDGTATGHRIVSEGLAALTFGSMAVDADDTIYVASVTGTRRSPRGLICALPDAGDGTCYLAPEGVTLHAITAPAPGVLYALTDKELVRLELPAE